MFILYFLLAIIILIVMLLVCPLGVAVNLSSSKLKLKLIVLGIPIFIPTEKKEKKPKKVKHKKPKKLKLKKQKAVEKEEEEKPEKKTDIIGMLELVSEILPAVGRFLGVLGKSIIIAKFEMFLLLYDEDCAKLGKNVGYANAVLSGLQPMLAAAFTLKDYKVLAAGSFGIERKDTVVDAKVFFVPIVIIVAVLKLGIFVVTKYLKRSNKKSKRA